MYGLLTPQMVPVLFPNASAQLLQGLVEYWPLSEASGTRNGLWAGLHLTDNNTVTGAAGPINLLTSSVFNRTNREHLSRADTPALRIAGKNWSYGLHFYLTAANAGENHMLTSYTATAGYIIYITNQLDHGSGWQFPAFAVRDGTDLVSVKVTAGGDIALALDTWHTLAATYRVSDGQMTLYFDDYTPVTGTQAGATDATNGFYLGWTPADTLYNGVHQGRLAGVARWDRLLTPADYTEYRNGGLGKPWLWQ